MPGILLRSSAPSPPVRVIRAKIPVMDHPQPEQKAGDRALEWAPDGIRHVVEACETGCSRATPRRSSAVRPSRVALLTATTTASPRPDEVGPGTGTRQLRVHSFVGPFWCIVARIYAPLGARSWQAVRPGRGPTHPPLLLVRLGQSDLPLRIRHEVRASRDQPPQRAGLIERRRRRSESKPYHCDPSSASGLISTVNPPSTPGSARHVRSTS